jgi:hypothetical protein
LIKIIVVPGILSTQVFALQVGSQASVPEPSTLVLIGAGLGVIGTLAWRRNRKQ